jgi:hypothetical protein
VTIVDLCESLLQDLRKLNENLKNRTLGPNTRNNHNRVIHVGIEDLRQHYIGSVNYLQETHVQTTLH